MTAIQPDVDAFMDLGMDADGDLTETMQFFDEVASLDSVLSLSEHSGSRSQGAQVMSWWHDGEAMDFSAAHPSSDLNNHAAGTPTSWSRGGDDKALSRSTSLASSTASAWHPSLGLHSVPTSSWKATHPPADEWMRTDQPVKHSAAYVPSCINTAIQEVMQMPRVQLQKQSMPLGLKLDAGAVLAQLQQQGGPPVIAAYMGFPLG